jgi:SAM-dependent methyltransferase
MTTVATMLLTGISLLAVGILIGLFISKRQAREIVEEAIAPVLKQLSLLHVNAGGTTSDSDEIAKLAGGLPVPSHELIQIVTPSFDLLQALRAGAEAVHFLCDLLERHGVKRESLRSVLDFGCGCGRVLRHFPSLGIHGMKLYGTDYNPVLIEWCTNNLPIAEFQVNNLEPPLNYANEAFDFVYAIFVFTHLTETLQFAWLDEIARILKSEGHLVITLHGTSCLTDLNDDQRQQFDSGQLVLNRSDRAGQNACGAFHPVQYVKERFTYAFDILEIIEPKQTGWQDAYLLQKRA